MKKIAFAALAALGIVLGTVGLAARRHMPITTAYR